MDVATAARHARDALSSHWSGGGALEAADIAEPGPLCVMGRATRAACYGPPPPLITLPYAIPTASRFLARSEKGLDRRRHFCPQTFPASSSSAALTTFFVGRHRVGACAY